MAGPPQAPTRWPPLRRGAAALWALREPARRWVAARFFDAINPQDWFDGWRRDRIAARWSKLGDLLRRHYMTAIILIALAFGYDWLRLVGGARDAALALIEQGPPPGGLRDHYYALGIAVAALGAMIAAPFALHRAWMTDRQTRTAEQGHITDRFTKAVEQLGAMREGKTAKGEPGAEPNTALRLGAIYALERIAQDSERDHIQIMETLCAYVQENGRKQDSPELTQDDDGSFDWLGFDKQLLALSPPPADVQAALTVIGRRAPQRIAHERRQTPPYALNLRGAPMQRAELNGLNFAHALLDGAKLDGAELNGAKLNWAKLNWAELNGAKLDGAELNGAKLNWAKLNGAELNGAKLNGAKLNWAKLNRAELNRAELNGAKLNGAKLNRAKLNWAKLNWAELNGAELNGAELNRAELKSTDVASANFSASLATSVDFRAKENLDQAQLDSLLGDADTTIPASCARPAHWSPEALDGLAAFKDHHRWLIAGCPKTADWRDRPPD